MKRRLQVFRLAGAVAFALIAGCAKAPDLPPDASEAHLHHHHAPHSGTVVSLGDEEYHIELVLDPSTGRLQGFVLDSELENFVRSSTPSIQMTATVSGTPRTLELAAVANPETGEIVGDTAQFEGTADWLKGMPQFDGVLKSVVIKGTPYSEVKFNFPKGNEGVH